MRKYILLGMALAVFVVIWTTREPHKPSLTLGPTNSSGRLLPQTALRIPDKKDPPWLSSGKVIPSALEIHGQPVKSTNGQLAWKQGEIFNLTVKQDVRVQFKELAVKDISVVLNRTDTTSAVFWPANVLWARNQVPSPIAKKKGIERYRFYYNGQQLFGRQVVEEVKAKTDIKVLHQANGQKSNRCLKNGVVVPCAPAVEELRKRMPTK